MMDKLEPSEGKALPLVPPLPALSWDDPWSSSLRPARHRRQAGHGRAEIDGRPVPQSNVTACACLRKMTSGACVRDVESRPASRPAGVSGSSASDAVGG
jgi:hypothetical protein